MTAIAWKINKIWNILVLLYYYCYSAGAAELKRSFSCDAFNSYKYESDIV